MIYLCASTSDIFISYVMANLKPILVTSQAEYFTCMD